MNKEVISKAQELGHLILNSEEYTVMRDTETEATKDEALVNAFAAHQEKRAQIEEASMEKEPDFEKIGALSRELEEIQQNLSALPMAQKLQQARKGFTDMMNAVNKQLQLILQPEEVEEGSCNGCCDGCGGCH